MSISKLCELACMALYLTGYSACLCITSLALSRYQFRVMLFTNISVEANKNLSQITSRSFPLSLRSRLYSHLECRPSSMQVRVWLGLLFWLPLFCTQIVVGDSSGVPLQLTLMFLFCRFFFPTSLVVYLTIVFAVERTYEGSVE